MQSQWKSLVPWRKRILRSVVGNKCTDGDQREFDLETKVITNGNIIIPEMFHSCTLNVMTW